MLSMLQYAYDLANYRYEKLEGKQFSMDDADYFVFHSPYNKVAIYCKLLISSYNLLNLQKLED